MKRLASIQSQGDVKATINMATSRRVKRREDVPDRCLYCGGPWALILGGVECPTCGRDLYVDELIAEAVRSGCGW